MFFETSWVRDNRTKLSELLTKELIGTYRPGKWEPCFATRPIRSLKHLIKEIPVVVQLDPEHWVTALNTDNLGGTLRCSINHRLDFIGGFSTTISVKALRMLTNHKAVLKVWLDREINAFLDVASPVVKAPQVWESGGTGEGIGIAILDTGIYPHPDLTSPTNRIVAFKDFVNGRQSPYDDNGHGTHCAGDAAGNGGKSAGKYKGPAPAAKLVGIKVLNKQGSGSMSNLLAGIQWCINNKDRYRIKILSMSLGGKATVSAREDPLCQAVGKAWRSGIVVCAAAGNEGPGARTISSPGIEPVIITVGAFDDKNTKNTGDDVIAGFSSRGPTIDGLTKPDVAAPGANVISLLSPNSYIGKTNKKLRVGRWYISLSGTSMATPVCAGVVALILEKCPGMTPGDVKKLLTSKCKTVSGLPNAEGAGRIDALASVNNCKGAVNKKKID